MADHLTILDRSRKAILALPNAAFKLWMCYWMNEDYEKESFVSQPEIRIQTTMGITSIVHWTQWLVRHGWLVPTGKTAYDKLVAMGRIPSDNSKQVKVYRVDDPTSKSERVSPPLHFLEGDTLSISENKVSGSSSVYGSGSDSRSNCNSTSIASSSSESAASPLEEAHPENQKQEPKPKTVKTDPKRLYKTKGKVRGKTSLDGTPWPDDFNHWPNADRLEWLKQHSDRDAKLEEDMRREFAELTEDEDAAGAAFMESMECREREFNQGFREAEERGRKAALKAAGDGNARTASPSSLSTKQTPNPKTPPPTLRAHPTLKCHCGMPAVAQKRSAGAPASPDGENLCQTHYDRDPDHPNAKVWYTMLMFEHRKGEWREAQF